MRDEPEKLDLHEVLAKWGRNGVDTPSWYSQAMTEDKKHLMDSEDIGCQACDANFLL